MTHVDLLGGRAISPSCERIVEADLFRDRRGELRCGQCATGQRHRRSALIPLGLGRSGAVPTGRKPGSREAL